LLGYLASVQHVLRRAGGQVEAVNGVWGLQAGDGGVGEASGVGEGRVVDGHVDRDAAQTQQRGTFWKHRTDTSVQPEDPGTQLVLGHL